MPIDKVRPIKQESAATGGAPADDVEFLNSPAQPNEDALDVRGVYLENDTSSDTACLLTRDASDNMTFTDPVAGSYTLFQLTTTGGGVTYNDFHLDSEPNTINHTYAITYSGTKVILETWTRTIAATTAKTIDYTYTGNKVNTEVRKVYNAGGVTILAQLTVTYSYSGNTVTGATYVRDI